MDFLKILVAALLGGLVGIEREWHGRAAGFRTHLLVATGSGLIMIVSLNLEAFFPPEAEVNRAIRVDLSHLAAGAVTGIGFLGAGAIMKSGATVHGLTTAASIWVVCAIGLACGAGAFLLASATTGLTLFALWILGVVENGIHGHRYYRVTVTYPLEAAPHLGQLQATLESLGFSLVSRSVELDRAGGRKSYFLQLRSTGKPPGEVVESLLDQFDGATGVRWE